MSERIKVLGANGEDDAAKERRDRQEEGRRGKEAGEEQEAGKGPTPAFPRDSKY
jgi:hypothetical protein